VVHLLCGDVVDGCAGGDVDDIGCVAGIVAADVGYSWVLDALLGICIFCLAGCGPIFLFGFAVDDETRESVYP
jgi:hypothetical protein